MTLTEIQLVALRMVEEAVIHAHDEGVSLADVLAEVSTTYSAAPTHPEGKVAA